MMSHGHQTVASLLWSMASCLLPVILCCKGCEEREIVRDWQRKGSWHVVVVDFIREDKSFLCAVILSLFLWLLFIRGDTLLHYQSLTFWSFFLFCSAAIFSSKCELIQKLGVGPHCLVQYSPSGTLITIAGFGNLRYIYICVCVCLCVLHNYHLYLLTLFQPLFLSLSISLAVKCKSGIGAPSNFYPRLPLPTLRTSSGVRTAATWLQPQRPRA